MIVYLLSGLGTGSDEWFRTKAEAIKFAKAMQEPGVPELTLEKVQIGDPNKYSVVAYLNGRGFIIERETVQTWPAVEYSLEGEGSGDWSEGKDYRGVPLDQVWNEEPEAPRRGFRIIEKGEV